MGDPATDKWLAEEQGWTPEQIAFRNAQIDAAATGPKPPGTRTPQEQEADILTAALQDLGIDLADKDFVAFGKWLSAQYGIAAYRGRFKGTWEDYVKSLAVRPFAPFAGVRPPGEPILGPAETTESPLELKLQEWRDVQEALAEAAAEAKREAGAPALALRTEKKRQELEDAQLKDAIADLKQRYPAAASKRVISLLAPELLQAWRADNARSREDYERLPPEIQEFAGLPYEGSLGIFSQGLDWGAFASDNGFGDEWQDGLLSDAFQRQIGDPIRAAAGQRRARPGTVLTPAQAKLEAEDEIAGLMGLLPGLRRQFNFAQQSDPDLKVDDWMAGEGGQLIAQVQQNNAAIAQERQRAAQVAVEARQAAAKATASKQMADIQTARNAMLKAVAAITSGSNFGGPEDVARKLGISIDDIDDLMPEFRTQVTEAQEWARVQLYREARASQGVANTTEYLQRAVNAGALTLEDAQAMVGQDMSRVPNWFSDIIKLTEQATAARTQRGQAVTTAQGAAQNLSANAASILAMTPAGGSRRNVQVTLDQLRGVEGEPDWRGIGVAEAQLNEAALFEDPEFLPYLREAGVAEQYAARYASDLARRATVMGPGGVPDPSQAVKFANPQEYFRSYLGEVGTGFAQYKQQKLLAPVEADKGFAPTLTQLLTDFGLRSPGASRNDLLAQNAEAIKKTYDEYLRRTSAAGPGSQPYGNLSLAQQRQLIGGGIL